MIQEWNYTKLSNSTQRAQTLPRPESDPGFKSEFLVSGAGCRPDRSQNITGFILLSARVTSPIAKYRKNRPLTVWEMLLNLLKSPIPQWWEKRKVIRNSYPCQDHHQQLITMWGSLLVHAYHVWSMSITAIVSYPAHRTRSRTTERLITSLGQPWPSNNKNLAIANRSRVSCAHNTSRASTVTPWLWNLG